MRVLAEFIMRGRMQATLVVAGCAAVPLLLWLSAAAGSLVLLRRGMNDAFGVLVWALLPALAWWFMGDPRVAWCWPVHWGWRRCCAAALLASGDAGQRGPRAGVWLGARCHFRRADRALAEELKKVLPDVLSSAYQQFSVEERQRLEALLEPVLTGLLAALLQIVTLLSLMLGRYWQGLLYNPGGFGKEFRELRFTPLQATGLLLGMLLGPNFGPELAVLTPLCSVPLVFAGLALMHGLVGQGRMARFWLVGLYVGLLLTQLIYPLLAVLALIDSLFDFRGRASRNRDAGPADGEG